MGYSGESKREYQREWHAKRRLKLVEKLGGRCVDCDTTERLEFDHDNLELKRMTVTSIISSNWNRSDIVKELENVVLRCNDCHKEKTISEYIRVHNKSRYGNGCRCDVCKEAHAEYMRSRRAQV